MHLTEAEPSALTLWLGGVKRFEHARGDLGWHAKTGIGNAYADVVAGRGAGLELDCTQGDIRRGDSEHTACARAGEHGIAAVDGEVDQRVFKLVRVRIGLP